MDILLAVLAASGLLLIGIVLGFLIAGYGTAIMLRKARDAGHIKIGGQHFMLYQVSR